MQLQPTNLSQRPHLPMPLFDDQQANELARVKAKLDPLVLAFFATKQPGSQFHVNDLIRFVWDREPYATATSPDRVMRELKKGKQLNYELVSRHMSLYRVLAVEAA